MLFILAGPTIQRVQILGPQKYLDLKSIKIFKKKNFKSDYYLTSNLMTVIPRESRSL